MTKPVVLSTTSYKVRNAASEDLGKMEELVIEEETGRVLYGVLSVGGFMHIGNQLIAVPWQRFRLPGDQKTVLLDIDKETLQKAPHFARDNWPDMSLTEWREDVDTYFTYNPAEEPDVADGCEFIAEGPRSRSLEEMGGDGHLARRVKFELSATKAFDMETIFVTATEGIVTLHGRVDSQAESILAENTALVAEGVRSVCNNLKVSKAA